MYSAHGLMCVTKAFKRACFAPDDGTGGCQLGTAWRASVPSGLASHFLALSALPSTAALRLLRGGSGSSRPGHGGSGRANPVMTTQPSD